MGSGRTGRDIDSGLCQKGFQRDSSGDHIRYFFYGPTCQDPIVRTKISHGVMGQVIGVELIALMARQCQLTKKQFLNLIDCSLDETGYRAILRDKGFPA